MKYKKNLFIILAVLSVSSMIICFCLHNRFPHYTLSRNYTSKCMTYQTDKININQSTISDLIKNADYSNKYITDIYVKKSIFSDTQLIGQKIVYKFFQEDCENVLSLYLSKEELPLKITHKGIAIDTVDKTEKFFYDIKSSINYKKCEFEMRITNHYLYGSILFSQDNHSPKLDEMDSDFFINYINNLIIIEQNEF